MRFLSWLAAMAILAASLTTASADPLTIRVSWVVVPNNLPPILFAKPGIARHQGPILHDGCDPLFRARRK